MHLQSGTVILTWNEVEEFPYHLEIPANCTCLSTHMLLALVSGRVFPLCGERQIRETWLRTVGVSSHKGRLGEGARR